MKRSSAQNDLKNRAARSCGTAIALRKGSRATRSESLRLRLDAQRLRKLSMHDMMPLSFAVETIYRSVYAPGGSERLAAHLDGLAYTVAGMCLIYAYQQNGTLRHITAEEMAAGLFRDGAKVLHFVDGRPTVQNLAVAADAIPAIIEALKAEAQR